MQTIDEVKEHCKFVVGGMAKTAYATSKMLLFVMLIGATLLPWTNALAQSDIPPYGYLGNNNFQTVLVQTEEKQEPVIEKGMTLAMVITLIGKADHVVEDGKALSHLVYEYYEKSSLGYERCELKVFLMKKNQSWLVYKVLGDSCAYLEAKENGRRGFDGTWPTYTTRRMW